MKDDQRRGNGRPTNLREGIQGKPFPAGKTFRPPPGPAADVPVDKTGTAPAANVETKE